MPEEQAGDSIEDKPVESMPHANNDPHRHALIRREIDGSCFTGIVENVEVGSDSGKVLYCIRYQDGDREHFTLDQLEAYKIDPSPFLVGDWQIGKIMLKIKQTGSRLTVNSPSWTFTDQHGLDGAPLRQVRDNEFAIDARISGPDGDADMRFRYSLLTDRLACDAMHGGRWLMDLLGYRKCVASVADTYDCDSAENDSDCADDAVQPSKSVGDSAETKIKKQQAREKQRSKKTNHNRLSGHRMSNSSDQTTTRANRIVCQRARVVVALEVHKAQQERGFITPPCTWCGLPTGCFCDSCNKPVCSACEDDLHMCVHCFQECKMCTEGEARKHAAVLARKTQLCKEQGISRSEDVDPVWVNATPEERMNMYLDYISSGQHCQPLKKRQHEANAPTRALVPGRPGQKVQVSTHFEECTTGVAAQEEDEEKVDEEDAPARDVVVKQIEEANKLASELRAQRRRGIANVGVPVPLPEVGDRGTAAVEVESNSRRSKRSERRQRKKQEMAAAAAKKATLVEKEGTKQFLQETAAGFVERPEQIYTQEASCTQDKPRKKAPKEVAEADDVAEDLMFGVWEAKLKYPGVAR